MTKNEELYNVEIKDINKLFVINGKVVRSPFKAVIPASQLEHFLCMVRANSVTDFSYNIHETKNVIPIFKIKKDINEETIESLNDKSKSIIDSLLNKVESEKL